ncbi:hypothetical protein EVAR_74252_1 [Eumeta japonica]|uniref:Uncharacterized protein n=1 Tax=Eumeta variegata TaxID=151549 RepID=A0A4C1SES2_EUMVA|nr:hypothetical protein EVAR_74252_1 [Eumeta japonica]
MCHTHTHPRARAHARLSRSLSRVAPTSVPVRRRAPTHVCRRPTLRARNKRKITWRRQEAVSRAAVGLPTRTRRLWVTLFLAYR